MPYSASFIGSLYSFPQRGSATSSVEVIWPTGLSSAAVNVPVLPRGYMPLRRVPEMISSRRETNSSTVLIAQTEVKVLEELYIFRRRTEVLRFLDRNPFLAPLLLEAAEKTTHFFPASQLSLEVISDFEMDDSSQLLASITTRLAVDAALERLDEFDADWWLEVAGQANGKLCIDLEFE